MNAVARAAGGAGLTLLLGAGTSQALAQAPVPSPAQRAAPAPATTTVPRAVGPGAQQGPLNIDSDRLEVRDREQRAVFSGNVVARRGDVVMRATVMTVLYEGQAAPGATGTRTPAPAPGAPTEAGSQQVRRIEMTGPVFFCQRDQTARGDNAVYERATELLTMTGNVVLTQGSNVVRGPRLIYNMRTNEAQVERDPARPTERVQTLLIPGSQNQQPAATAPAPGQPPC